MTELEQPPPTPRVTRRARVIVLAVAMLVSAGLAIYLIWPASATDEQAEVDAMLPTKADLPGYVPSDGLTGTLSKPAGHESGASC